MSIEEGLSQSSAFSIVQDEYGFIWIGTQGGLNCYNGVDFLQLADVAGSDLKLSNNYINRIVIEKGHILWIGTQTGGINRIDLETMELRIFEHDPANKQGLKSNNIKDLEILDDKYLIVATSLGLNVIDLSSLDIQTDGAMVGFDVNTLAQSDRNQTWVGTNENGLYLYDRLNFAKIELPNSWGNKPITKLLQDKNGNLWIGSTQGLYFWNEAKTVFKHIPIESSVDQFADNRVRALLEDKEGDIWVGTLSGLQRISMDKYDTSLSTFDIVVESGVEAGNITDLYQDSSGLIWVGTFTHGVYKGSKRNAGFQHISKEKNNMQSLSSPLIWSIIEDDQWIWVGTQNGLNKISYDFSVFEHLLVQSKDMSSSIQSVLKIENDLWCGTDGDGIQIIHSDGTISSMKHSENDQNSIGSNGIFYLHQGKGTNIWIGSRNGLTRYNYENKAFKHWTKDSPVGQRLSSDRVYCVLEDDGLVWICTSKGLNVLNVVTGNIDHILTNPDDENSLTGNRVLNILKDSQGYMWIGTTNGLNRYVKKHQKFTRIGKKQGLFNEVIYSSIEDREGRIWISTSYGLSFVNPKTMMITNYGPKDGLASLEFNLNAVMEDHNGKLYFGGVEGLTIVDPKSIAINLNIPKVAITKVKIAGVDQNFSIKPSQYKELQIEYNQNFVTFEFSALDFTIHEKNKYLYQLEGYEDVWHDPGKYNVASYSNLPGGDYRFKVKASNNDGVWNEQGISMRMHVSDPPWKTLAAYVLYGIIFFVFFYYIIQYKTKAQTAKTMTKLRVITKSLNNSLDIDEVANKLLEHLKGTITHCRIELFLLSNDDFESIAVLEKKHTHELLPIELKETLLGKAKANQSTVFIEPLKNRYTDKEDQWLNSVRQVLILPLMSQNAFMGCAMIFPDEQIIFSKSILGFIQTLIGHAEMALQNALLYQKVKNIASLDSLTDLLTRRSFFELAEKEFNRAQRYKRHMGIIMIDIDHFKAINDDHGHQVGDEVLKLFAQLSRSYLRDVDFMGRYGGEEFIIVLTESDFEITKIVAKRLCKSIASNDEFELKCGIKQITASFGISAFTPQSSSLKELIELADKGMYKAKNNGRNRVEYID